MSRDRYEHEAFNFEKESFPSFKWSDGRLRDDAQLDCDDKEGLRHRRWMWHWGYPRLALIVAILAGMPAIAIYALWQTWYSIIAGLLFFGLIGAFLVVSRELSFDQEMRGLKFRDPDLYRRVTRDRR